MTSPMGIPYPIPISSVILGVVRRGEVPPFGACADGPHLMSDAANESGWGVSGGTPERVKGSALARPNAVWYTVTIPKSLT